MGTRAHSFCRLRAGPTATSHLSKSNDEIPSQTLRSRTLQKGGVRAPLTPRQIERIIPVIGVHYQMKIIIPGRGKIVSKGWEELSRTSSAADCPHARLRSAGI
jgi:hypothetical protein